MSQSIAPFVVVLAILTLGVSPILSVSATESTSQLRGQLVLKAGSSGSWEAYVFRGSVVYDGSSFKMWYAGEDNGSYSYENIGLAVSLDGYTWTRQQSNPVLKRGGLGQWDQGSVTLPFVIYDESEYKMWYAGEQYSGGYCCSQISVGYATSTDGITWTKVGGGPVLKAGIYGSWDDNSVSLPDVIKTSSGYLMLYRGVGEDGVGRTGLAISTDGVQWTKKGMINLPRSSWDAYYTQYVSGITTVANEYVASYSGYPSPGKGNEIGFASSTDGKSWAPFAGNPLITQGNGTNDWDCCGIGLPTMLIVGSNYYVYYTAWNGYTDQIVWPSYQAQNTPSQNFHRQRFCLSYY